MLRLMFALIFLTGTLSAVYANDTSMVAVGGSATPLHGENPQIRMVEETVHLDLYKDSYVTSVDFLFANDGTAIIATMGFPERGVGTDRVSGIIDGFTTTVDGHTVTAHRIKAKSDGDSYQAYWTKSVVFADHQQRRIHVKFRSPYGGGIGGTLAAYDFTGGNWHGKVTKSVLLVTAHTGAPALAVAELNDKIAPSVNRGDTREFVWHDWEAQAKFVLSQTKR